MVCLKSTLSWSRIWRSDRSWCLVASILSRFFAQPVLCCMVPIVTLIKPIRSIMPIHNVPCCAQLRVNVRNINPKLSTTGDIVNGHDGTYRFYEGYYWYHAAEYGLCKEPAKNGCDQTPGPVGPPYPAPGKCGFQADHNVSIWRSKDLSSGSWEFMGRAARCAEDIPDCHILYRPHMVKNPNTGLYVLFVNYVTSGTGYAGYAVFTSEAPQGPFTLRNTRMNITRLCPGPVATKPCGQAQGGAGDFDVVVDKNGAGYIIYSAQFYMGIEKLTDDFLYSTGANASVMGGLFGETMFPEYFTEAPVLFERQGTYYALFGHCCCFCYQGSGVMVYTASSPAGPWKPQCSDVQPQNMTNCLAPNGNLACVPDESDAISLLRGAPTPGQGCSFGPNNKVGPPYKKEHSVTRSQQNFVITVVPSSGGDTQYIWTGDRWQQSPDGLKGHEGQFWTVLEFDEEGRIKPIQWEDTITFEV
eukprot:m.28605 g.28605  ORF g.28605 m.28605 type:complete len:471 (-) comp8015_c0_seq2:119-1531(-)